jgi:hypothetical protein
MNKTYLVIEQIGSPMISLTWRPLNRQQLTPPHAAIA